ncbi:MAG: beta-ketoacyl-[acyl-carrier-protein] synthase family protein, partial [Phycisphaerae bacterium]
LPNPERLAECMVEAIRRAGIEPADIDIISTHATSTEVGDEREAMALRQVFGDFPGIHINNTKSFIGHAMGAAGALELAGNLGAFDDGMVHATINIDDLDPTCAMRGLVINEARSAGTVDYILNNSFGMLGINSAVVVKRFKGQAAA